MEIESAITFLNKNRRRGLLTALIGLTQEREHFFHDFILYIEVSVFLGIQQIVEKKGGILPFIPERIRACDLDIVVEFRDSLTATSSARELLDAVDSRLVTSENHGYQKEQRQQPFASLGGLFSDITQMLNILGQSFHLPIISPTATSSELSGQAYFSRTIPTNAGDAMAIAIYLEYLSVFHVGLLHDPTPWGRQFQKDLTNELVQRNITFVSVVFTEATIDSSIQRLAASGYRYFVGIDNGKFHKLLFTAAYEHKIMGHPGYTWILTEGSSVITSPEYHLSQDTDISLAKAINGIAFVTIEIDWHDQFEEGMLNFSTDRKQQQKFTASHHQPNLLKNFTFPTPPRHSLFHYLAFDAAIALGIASCETPNLFTGEDLQERILSTNFTGVSGAVLFDPATGNRNLNGIRFAVRNVLISEEKSTETDIYFMSNKVAEVSIGDSLVKVLQPFTYSDNTTFIPKALPLLEVDQNLIHPIALIVGLTLGGVVITTALGLMIWTLRNRNDPFVCASQPFFLCQLCIGASILSIAIVPLSLQEPIPKYTLDTACMAVPWLISIGFVTAFSALFSKASRLNELVKNARHFRRIKVKPKDVMKPFFCLLSINIVILIAWSILVPMRWERIEFRDFDRFGRAIGSYGSCRVPSKSYALSITFLSLEMAINWFSLLQCLYKYYRTRKKLAEYSESTYLYYSTFILLETFTMSIPLLYAVLEEPTANFLLRSIIISIICLAILLPMFGLRNMSSMSKNSQTSNKPFIMESNTK